MVCKHRLVRQLERMGKGSSLNRSAPGGCRSATNSAPTSSLRSLHLASTLICLKLVEPTGDEIFPDSQPSPSPAH
jgi:hypothetical protein